MGGPGARHRSLGERLVELTDVVGRAAELDLVRAALEADEPPFAVLFLHGPGGIGKSSLLDLIAESVSHDGATVVRLDGAVLALTPEAVLSKLADSLEVPVELGAITCPSGRLVLLIDDYERLAPLDGWVQTALLPRLPASALTVIAARNPPDPAWRSDSSWGGPAARGVAPEPQPGRESRVPPGDRRGVGPARGDAPARRTGTRWACRLLADVVRREGACDHRDPCRRIWSGSARTVRGDVPTDLHRRALRSVHWPGSRRSRCFATRSRWMTPTQSSTGSGICHSSTRARRASSHTTWRGMCWTPTCVGETPRIQNGLRWRLDTHPRENLDRRRMGAAAGGVRSEVRVPEPSRGAVTGRLGLVGWAVPGACQGMRIEKSMLELVLTRRGTEFSPRSPRAGWIVSRRDSWSCDTTTDQSAGLIALLDLSRAAPETSRPTPGHAPPGTTPSGVHRRGPGRS